MMMTDKCINCKHNKTDEREKDELPNVGKIYCSIRRKWVGPCYYCSGYKFLRRAKGWKCKKHGCWIAESAECYYCLQEENEALYAEVQRLRDICKEIIEDYGV